MQITVDVPEEFAAQTIPAGKDPARTALEALDLPAPIIDEALGRYEASRLGVTVIGTLGILRDADNAGLLDLQAALDRLRATTFRQPAIFAKLLERRR